MKGKDSDMERRDFVTYGLLLGVAGLLLVIDLIVQCVRSANHHSKTVKMNDGEVSSRQESNLILPPLEEWRFFEDIGAQPGE